ncbi:MAG: fluoride efflux transporter CrcB [Legionella sp.]|nr:fluoride efflux transporter CrcB [Legionella sp.]
MLATIIAVASGGAIGAIARLVTVIVSANIFGTRFPYGTLLVNGIGSFLAGFLLVIIMERFAGSELLRLFLVVGFLGAYTTFSSFSWETWALYESGEHFLACLNVLFNNVVALGLAFLGISVGRMVGG